MDRKCWGAALFLCVCVDVLTAIWLFSFRVYLRGYSSGAADPLPVHPSKSCDSNGPTLFIYLFRVLLDRYEYEVHARSEGYLYSCRMCTKARLVHLYKNMKRQQIDGAETNHWLLCSISPVNVFSSTHSSIGDCLNSVAAPHFPQLLIFRPMIATHERLRASLEPVCVMRFPLFPTIIRIDAIILEL